MDCAGLRPSARCKGDWLVEFSKQIRAHDPGVGVTGPEHHSAVTHVDVIGPNNCSTVINIAIQVSENDPIRDKEGEEAQEADAMYQHVETGLNATLPQAIGINVVEGPHDGKHELRMSVLIPHLAWMTHMYEGDRHQSVKAIDIESMPH